MISDLREYQTSLTASVLITEENEKEQYYTDIAADFYIIDVYQE